MKANETGKKKQGFFEQCLFFPNKLESEYND